MQEHIKAIPSNRLQFFPIMMFAVIMGLGGLTLVYERMTSVFFFPISVAMAILVVTVSLFFLILFFYILKIIRFKEEVKKDFLTQLESIFLQLFLFLCLFYQ